MTTENILLEITSGLRENVFIGRATKHNNKKNNLTGACSQVSTRSPNIIVIIDSEATRY